MSCGKWQRVEMGHTGTMGSGLVRRCTNVGGYVIWEITVSPLPKPYDDKRYAATVYDNAARESVASGLFVTESGARRFADRQLRVWRRRRG